MNLYDEVINTWMTLTKKHSLKNFQVNLNDSWPDVGKNNFILPADMAYELGGSKKNLFAIGATAITSDTNLISKDEILLLGKDLTEIKEDCIYARISICLVDDNEIGQGEVLFGTVKAIDYTRYHVSPEGFMMRVSAFQKREGARVSKDAIKNKISFENIGNALIKSFHKNPKIKAVKVIFINDDCFNFKELEDSVKKCELITKAIDHISESSLMDCNTCGLQKVCEEVEGMRELHFNNQSNKE